MKPADGSPAKAPQSPKEPEKSGPPQAAIPLAWDFPNTQKTVLPECEGNKVIFQGGNTCVAVKKLKDHLMVRRFENDELKVKEAQACWKNPKCTLRVRSVTGSAKRWKTPA